jgi:hypothetical protein
MIRKIHHLFKNKIRTTSASKPSTAGDTPVTYTLNIIDNYAKHVYHAAYRPRLETQGADRLLRRSITPWTRLDN